MDHRQSNRGDDAPTLTSTQSVNAVSLTSSVATSTSASTSLMIHPPLKSKLDRSVTRTSRRRHDPQHLASRSTATASSLLPATTEITERNERREARPLGTCVRKCSQCGQLKHILLAECTACFRMMDIDLKDCKCQTFRRTNITDHFICSICNSVLTLDGYIICANRTCQTTLSALIDQEDTNELEENSFVTASLTNVCYPKSTYRTVAVQVNTLVNISPLLQFLSINMDEKNGESSLLSSSKRHFPPSESARQLLDTIERLHTNQRLNTLTAGQLQRKVRYAMSKLKYIDERASVQHDSLKTIKTNRSTPNSKRNTECNGRVDMAVTVRQIEKRHHHHPNVSTDQNWKPYVDRLFEQGHSADEIRRLLREASERTMQSDDQRLQDVFLYIDQQANQPRAKSTLSGIAFVPNSTRTKAIVDQQDKGMVSDTVCLMFNSKEMGVTKDKSISPSVLSNNDSIKSSVLSSHKHQLKTNTERTPRDDTSFSKDQPILQSVTPSTSGRSISHHSKKSSYHSSQANCIHALRQIQDNLQTMDPTDARLQPHLLNVQSTLSRLIDTLETNLRQSASQRDDNIDSVMTQCIEALDSEQKIIAAHSKQPNFMNLNGKISKILEILRGYRQPVALTTAGNESSMHSQHLSNTTTVLPESLVLLRQATENTKELKRSPSSSVRLPFETALDPQQREDNLEHQETVGLIRCRPIPYTFSNEKQSTETLKEVLICSTDDVNLGVKDLSAQESDLSADQSQTKWLNSLLSKISDNSDSISHISSATPSLAGLSRAPNGYNNDTANGKQTVDEQPSSPNSNSKISLSTHPQSTDVLELTDDHQDTLHDTDVLKLEKEHALSIVIPAQVFSISDELLERKSTSFSQPRSYSEDQLTSFQEEKSSASVAKLNLDSDEISQKSSSASTLHDKSFDERHQVGLPATDSKPQSVTDQPVSSSNLDLSDQLDQLQPYEDENRKALKTNQSDPKSAQRPNASHNNISWIDEQASTAIPKLFIKHNDIHNFQLPESAQYASLSDTIQSSSFLTHFSNQNDIPSSQKSISPSTSLLNAQARAVAREKPIDSNSDSIPKRINSSKKTENEESDNDVPLEVRITATLPSKYSIAPKSASTVLSPSQITKSENPEYKKLATPTSLPLKTSPYSGTKKVKEHTSIDSAPKVLINRSSGSVTPATKDTSPTSSSDSEEHTLPKNTDDQQSKAGSEGNRTLSRTKTTTRNSPTAPISSPYSSLPTFVFDDDKHMKLSQQLEQDNKPSRENTEYSNTSSSVMHDQLSQPSNTSLDDDLKKFPSKEKTTASDYSFHTSEISDQNPHIHSSSGLEQSRQKQNDRSTRNQPLKSDSLIKHTSSLSDKRLMRNDSHETKNVYGTELKKQSKNQSDDRTSTGVGQHPAPTTVTSNSVRINSAPSLTAKKQRISSTAAVVSQSSAIKDNELRRDLSPRPSPFRMKNKQSTAEDARKLRKVSSFKRAEPIDSLIASDSQGNEREKSIKNPGKTLANVSSRPLKSKRKHSSITPTVSAVVPSSLIAKLLPKRSAIKNPSTTAQSTKLNTTSSMTDMSTSSNSTVATDHLLSTHSTVSGRKEVNQRSGLKGEYLSTSDSTFKRRVRKKLLEDQLFISSHRKGRSPERSTTKLSNGNLLTNLDLLSDADMKSHEDMSEFIIIDDPSRQKQQKNKVTTGSKMKSFKLKARSDRQGHPIDSSKLPILEQSRGEIHMKKWSSNPFGRRPIIRLPVTQIEKFECGTIGPRFHPSSIAHQLSHLPLIHDQSSSPLHQTTPSLTDRLYSLMSPEKNDDKEAFEAILNWEQQQTPKTEQNKFHYMYLLNTTTKNPVRGKQYPIMSDEIDMIDDPNTCTVMHKWAFADLVNAEREKCLREPTTTQKTSKKRSKFNQNIRICLRKRPLTQFEQNLFKEVDIISMIDSQTTLLHIPSITVDNQVFIKNRKFKCDETFDEHCQISTIYHSTLAPWIDRAIEGSKCLCLIGGGKYSGKTSLLRSLMDLFVTDLNRLLSTSDIYIKSLGICHNRIVDLLQNNSPIRIVKSSDESLAPNDEFHLENADDVDYISFQIKKRRRFIHQLIEINFREKGQSTLVGSVMILMLASSQYVYTQKLCSHRRKFLINSLNKTILALRRALLGIRQSPNRIRAAFNNDILTRLIQPYVFDERSHVCYIGMLNPGHRHRVATKSTLDFARNLRFCLRRIHQARRKRKKSVRRTADDENLF